MPENSKKIASIQEENKVHFYNAIDHNPYDVMNMIDIINTEICASSLNNKNKVEYPIICNEKVESNDNVSIFSYKADKSFITTVTMAVIQVLSNEFYEDVLAGEMNPQHHNDIMSAIIRKLGFVVCPANTKSEKKISDDLKESLYVPMKKVQSESSDIGGNMNIKVKSAIKEKPITIKPKHCHAVSNIHSILEKSASDMIRNNGLSAAGQLKIHSVKKGISSSTEAIKKLRKEVHDVYGCKVGSSVSLVPSLDFICPSSKYLSAKEGVMENLIIKELDEIYNMFNAIIKRPGDSKMSLRALPHMLFYSLIEKSQTISKILGTDNKYNEFEGIQERLGEEKIEFLKYYLGMAMSMMAKETGYEKGVNQMIKIIGGKESDFKWLPSHIDNYSTQSAYIIDCMFKLSSYISRSHILNVRMIKGLAINPRVGNLYKIFMNHTKYNMYRSGLMRSSKDDLLAIAPQYMDNNDVAALDELLGRLQNSIISNDNNHHKSLEVGLIRPDMSPDGENIPYFEFVSNLIAGIYMSMPLVHMDNINNYASKLIRLDNQPTKAILKLYDPCVNLTDKMTILSPITKIISTLDKLAGVKLNNKDFINLVDAKFIQLPLDWFINMFSQTENDESIMQLLICISLIKSILTERDYEQVYITIFKSLCKVLSDANAKPLLMFLNKYEADPESEEEENDQADNQLTLEQVAEIIKQSNLGHVFKYIAKFHAENVAKKKKLT